MDQMRANINMDPQTPAEMELNDFPALFVQRPPSSWSPLAHIPIYDLYTIPPSPPPEEMAGPVRTAATDNRMTIQPPRPPNAWILYRSDKLRNLPPTAPGVPRRAQADVSKLISEMWKNELDDVRAEYERRADARKAEHQAMYPGYRFHPMKKEEKERLREEKRQEKERDRAQSRRGRARPTPYATSFVPTPMPHPLAAYYQPEVRYGPAGPSPPLSAASSPNDASPYPDSQHGSDEQPNCQSTHASPHPDSYTSATSHSGSLPSMPTSSYESSIPPSQPLPLHPSPSQPGVSHLPIPGPSQWHPQQQPSGNADPATTPIWSNYNPSHGQFPPDGTVSQDYVSFNVPPLTMQPWMTSEGTSEFEQSIHALLSATGDPSIFQLSHFDPNSLTSHPSGEIEVSMGQLHFPFETQPNQLSSPDFSNFDFGSLSGPSSHYLDNTNTGISPVDHTTDLASLFPNHAVDPTSSTSENVDFSSYLNFDDVPPDVTPSRHPPPTQSQSMPPIEQQAIETTTTPSAPYIPPAGAAYSSTRRVGASWKSSFTTAPDSPIDHSPPRQWGVPAS